MKSKLLILVLVLSLIAVVGIVSTTYANISPIKTEPKIGDSDNDSYSDLCEQLHKSNPNDAQSKPSSNITINVPKDVKTIQEAINIAIDGDTIVVSQGKYKGNINFNGKSITITSIDPLDSDVTANTIIEATENGSVITVDTNSVLKGLTITSKNLDCRGIYVQDASPTIENCTITDNQTTASGGGIYISTTSSKPQITNCIISGNTDNSTDESAQVSGGTPQISYSVVGQDLVNITETTITPTEESTPPADETPASESTTPEPFSKKLPPLPIRPTTETLTTTKSLLINSSMTSPKLALATEQQLSGDLFAGGSSPAVVYKYLGGTSWEQVSPTGTGLGLEYATLCLCEYNGELYAGTRAYSGGTGKIWIYDGNFTWTLVGNNLDQQVSSLVVYNDGTGEHLYAGTSYGTPSAGRLYRYDGGTIWTKVVDTNTKLGIPGTTSTWSGFRSLYVSDITGSDILYIGDIGYDIFGHYNGTSFTQDVNKGGSCIWDHEFYVNKLYVSALGGMIYQSSNGTNWTSLTPVSGGNVWELETFQNYLYANAGPCLYKYNGSNFVNFWNNTNGDIISMIETEDALIFGVGEEAGYYSGSGTGKIYAYDGVIAPQEISGNMSGGIQALISFSGGVPPEPVISYVDGSVVTTGGDGTSWTTAFKYLQDAFNDIRIPAVNEIRVSQGRYKPDQNKDNPTGTGDRTATFQLKNGVTIKGGYVGSELIKNGDFEATLNSTWPYVPGWYTDGMWYIEWNPSTNKGEHMYIYVASYNQKSYKQITQPWPGLHIVVGEEYRVKFTIRDHYGNFTPDGAYAKFGGLTIPIVSTGLYEQIITATSPDSLQFVVPAYKLSSFQLDDVSVSNLNPDSHDIEGYPTILSGDINVPNNINDNSYHVITGKNVGSATILDGLFIISGNSNNTAVVPGEDIEWTRSGGGMRFESSSPVVQNCLFYDNNANWSGGAIANLSSYPKITNCTFGENIVSGGGGAIFGYESWLHIKNSTFTNNYSKCWGGAIKNESSGSIITNCVFSNNTGHIGGAVDNGVNSSTTVANCVFTGNAADDGGTGGGLSNRNSSVVVTNCTFNQNHAGNGGGIYNFGDDSSVTLINCIIWDNPDNYPGTNEVKNNPFFYKPIDVSYCDIKNSYQEWGGGYKHNIDSNPLFEEDGIYLLEGSPCIDTADDSKASAIDMLGRQRIDIPGMGWGNISDMGAYEFTP